MEKKPKFIKLTSPDGKMNVVPYSHDTKAYYEKMNSQTKDTSKHYKIEDATDEEISKFHPSVAHQAAELETAKETAAKLTAAEKALEDETLAHKETAAKLTAAEKALTAAEKEVAALTKQLGKATAGK